MKRKAEAGKSCGVLRCGCGLTGKLACEANGANSSEPSQAPFHCDKQAAR